MKQLKTIMVVSLALVAGTALADNINGVEIDFESIGGAGNSNDSTGYGAVVDDYGISTMEISFDQFSPSGLASGGSGDKPAVNMTWHVAAQYANWLTSSNVNVGAYAIFDEKVTAIDRSYRNADGLLYVLPTENEWYKAAYFTGSGYSLYANGTGTAPVAGTDANYSGAIGSPWDIGGGSIEQNNGTFDMMGNVWEWLESTADGEEFDPLDDGQNMVVRGGAYHLSSHLGSDQRIGNAQRGVTDVDAGIRIVVIPEPGTISLMGLSTIGLFVTRRIRRRRLAGKTLFPVEPEHLCDTFGARNSAYGEEEGMDLLAALEQVAMAYLLTLWGGLCARYAGLDKRFWNRMVATHERRIAQRMAFKVAFKKRTLDGLDSFLALIMK